MALISSTVGVHFVFASNEVEHSYCWTLHFQVVHFTRSHSDK